MGGRQLLFINNMYSLHMSDDHCNINTTDNDHTNNSNANTSRNDSNEKSVVMALVRACVHYCTLAWGYKIVNCIEVNMIMIMLILDSIVVHCLFVFRTKGRGTAITFLTNMYSLHTSDGSCNTIIAV